MATRLGQDGKTYLVRPSARPRGEDLDAVEEALATAERFDRCLVRVKRLGDEIERMARGPGGTYLTELLEELREHIRLTAHQLAAAPPAARCQILQRQGVRSLLSARLVVGLLASSAHVTFDRPRATA